MLLSDKFKNKDLYRRFSLKAIDAITAADIYTELQKLGTCDESNLEAFWYLHQLLKALQMNASGHLINTEANSAAIASDTEVNGLMAQINQFPRVVPVSKGDLYSALANGISPRLVIVPFASDGSGNLAADIPLLAAKAGYTGVIEHHGIVTDTAITPAWVINGTTALATITNPEMTSGKLQTDIKGITHVGSGDNTVISLDTTTSGLGNVTNFVWFGKGWYE